MKQKPITAKEIMEALRGVKLLELEKEIENKIKEMEQNDRIAESNSAGSMEPP